MVNREQIFNAHDDDSVTSQQLFAFYSFRPNKTAPVIRILPYSNFFIFGAALI